MRAWILGAVVALLAGCVAPPVERGPYERRQEFSVEEHAPYAKEGSASIDGQVFLRTIGGDVKVGAGSQVSLLPTTKYFWENMQAHMQGRAISNGDQRALQFMRTARADGEGRFEFESVPAGRYYLMSSVYWQAPTGYRYSLERHGSRIIDIVEVEEGENLSVSLTK